MRVTVVLLALLVAACYSVVVDDFSVGTGEQTLSATLPVTVGSGGSAAYFSFYEDPDCSGLADCHRVILLGISRGNAESTFTASVQSSNGNNEFAVSAPSGSTSEFTLKYDGSNSQDLDRSGLDLDLSSTSGVQMTVSTTSSLPTTVTVYSGSQSCDAFTTISSNGLIQLPFSSFSGDCVLSSVGAITLEFQPAAGSTFTVRQIETFVSDGSSPTPVLSTRTPSPSPSRSRATTASPSRTRAAAATVSDGSISRSLQLDSNQGGTITVGSITATFPLGTWNDNTVVTARLTPVAQAGLSSSGVNTARAGDILTLSAQSTSGNSRSPRTYYEICFGLTGDAADTPMSDLCLAYVNGDNVWQCDDNTVYSEDNDVCGTTDFTGVFSLVPQASAVADNDDDDDIVIDFTLSNYDNVRTSLTSISTDTSDSSDTSNTSNTSNDNSAASSLATLSALLALILIVM